MAAGHLALVLHGHLPFVRRLQAGSLQEDWFHQAVLESYLPLLHHLQRSAEDPRQAPALSLSLSPTLLAMLADPLLCDRFPGWVACRQRLLEWAPPEHHHAAAHLGQQLEAMLAFWRQLGGRLIPAFQELQRQGVLDLLTCGATHGYLPLLREPRSAVVAQLRIAVEHHRRHLGCAPLGIWLPECAYFEGLDRLMAAEGLRYAVLDAHGLLQALPRPRYSIYAPICSPGAVAFVGRDSTATLPVWSARDGYPGQPCYREFYRDLGWDLPLEQLQEMAIPNARPLGLKLHAVGLPSCPLAHKPPYVPENAEVQVQADAEDYVQGRVRQLRQLQLAMGGSQPPLVVAPFDAELFGHWWYEGPRFLAALWREAPHHQIRFTTLRRCLEDSPQLQLCRPAPSSWGQGGYHAYWLNDSNAWAIPLWHRCGLRMESLAARHGHHEQRQHLLRQAARELLLLQSSDWSFILRSGTTTDLAREQIHRHVERFQTLADALDSGQAPPPDWLKAVEAEDNLFPDLNLEPWLPVPSTSA
ncbi:glycoside hydrolase family 57 protein [Candidatus Synechococcus spongiarum]|uniref:Glycogen branching enzyme, GH-57-type, archaeal n=1 Tax=Candidatus Synechococcus spongiarum TaxID=431041 RepID=A0A165AFF7_9SYNE|nr:1,4-alpha-glucan branching protein domain-containing protein [Candidatus Synechococcus spongiarum]SAY38717.1 Glycogen branching enzyme, GH-57-type, archaeal (EC 2.4.1.18) [Candidatus Synechococcus spongiarum]